MARRIVETWKTADALADGKGDRFVAILQPIASVGAPHLDHLTFPPLKQEILAQHPAVYPLIRAYATEAGISFIDLSHAYDGDDPLYIDFCHVSLQAHHQLVPRLNATLREQGMIPPTTGITSQQ
ncbi:hypothetical protein [Roseovarius pelagicus]|uniref:GDSL-like Lipase/Acylhydrolase family protein n=1 Tax=Roseovarius pelagicus TaxID=2980108 RepID=A0ABY6DCV5_9RHOB|nr:hypothetical protein [Roseovarius pelagicus]UXX83981.1 hypothetical protein N7U68_04820 [Roseovarius pelagicus]